VFGCLNWPGSAGVRFTTLGLCPAMRSQDAAWRSGWIILRQCTSPLNGLGTRTRKRLPTREENNEALTSISSPMTDPNQLWERQTQGAGPGRPKRTKSSPTRAAEYSIRTKCLAKKPAKVTRGLLVKSQRVSIKSNVMPFFASLALNC